MFMDPGLSEELESALGYALAYCLPGQRENVERFDRWVRAEAAKVSTNGSAPGASRAVGRRRTDPFRTVRALRQPPRSN
jgi:hypothetical protein